MTAIEYIEERDCSNLIDYDALVKWLHEYGKQQYNQAIMDIANEDLLPDKERNLKKFLKK